ncbi:zinc finger protein 830 [Leguminivora glycinivorella]|uniref:zinc finger protein 830 n=1 Tax=Leguminivora glycinivorella TaxID=1035111 RepID=UPI00200E8964|nr:zinc finger protein 830 [Leguminivora glycinivorella]
MSLRAQMEKKKAQEEMRRLMAERKKKDVKTTKIDNPLAKYNNLGQLMCLLCSSVVRSEAVWPVHLNSKQHRENVEKAKELKKITNDFTDAKKVKRLGVPPADAPPEKKLKSILKNAGDVKPVQLPKSDVPNVISYHNEEIKRAPLNLDLVQSTLNGSDENAGSSRIDKVSSGKDKTPPVPEAPIPEGFFDDPILDAKVRNIEYKDPVEEEWEKFQKEIKEQATASAEIIAGEQEEATAERQIDEIEEQMRNWNRVLELELKKEETKKNKLDTEQQSENEEDSNDEGDIDEFLDWRAKKAYS